MSEEAIISETERRQTETQTFYSEMVERDLRTASTEVARCTVSEPEITGVR